MKILNLKIKKNVGIGSPARGISYFFNFHHNLIIFYNTDFFSAKMDRRHHIHSFETSFLQIEHEYRQTQKNHKIFMQKQRTFFFNYKFFKKKNDFFSLK